jgi:1,4-alpha-glucan branching enzyme
MQKLYFHILFLIVSFCLKAQVVTTSPLLPTDNQQVVVTFYADRGNQGLINYTGDIYAHTGVITDKSTSATDWKYVKAAWTTNLPACKLTKIETNRFQLTLASSIRGFYGVPAGDKILKLAFVFRSSDGSKTGREANGGDIFATVYEEGVNVNFIKPSSLFVLADSSQNIKIEVAASGNDSICLYLDNQKIKSVVGSNLIDSVKALGYRRHSIVAVAYKNTNIASDTVWFLVKGHTLNQPIPPGIEDGINYKSNQSVTFSILAPYKNYIYLIGDFNNWIPDSSYILKKDNDRFWLNIDNLTPNKEYIFQYLIDGDLRIADPYCEKISDPNDKYISGSVYPNLLPYPESKTTDIAGVFETGQTPYTWHVDSFVPPSKEKLLIYELLIRDYTANKDIKTITDTLLYLKNLGINAIELMPFSEFEGNDSWGYNPSFYFAPDKAYGTKNDYKKFIDECHKNGIAVIQDMVLNHSYGQSPLVRMYMDGGKPSAQNPWYNRDHNMQNPDAQWGYDFNHNSIYTQQLVDSITSYWMNEYKVDGFRFDFTKGFTNTIYGPTSWASDYDTARIRILKRIADEIWKRKPNAYVIFEHLSDNPEEMQLAEHGIMLWGNMNYAYSQAAMGYSNGWDLNWISYKYRGWDNPNIVGYMESHDEERLMYRNLNNGNSNVDYNIKHLGTALKRTEMAAVFFILVPGPKMIWQFGELGYDVSIDFGGRLSSKPLHWEYFSNTNRNHLFQTYTFLAKLKQEEPIFSTADFVLDASGSVKRITLHSGNEHVFIVGNFDVTEKSVSLELPGSGTWYEYFTSDSIELSSTNYSFTLEPGGFRLYCNKKLAGFGTFPMTSIQSVKKNENIKVYPNPFTTQLNINSSFQIDRFEIIDLQGRLLARLNGNTSKINTSQIPIGMYYLKVLYRIGEMEIIKLIRK